MRISFDGMSVIRSYTHDPAILFMGRLVMVFFICSKKNSRHTVTLVCLMPTSSELPLFPPTFELLFYSLLCYIISVYLDFTAPPNVWLGYGLDHRWTEVRFPTWAGDFPLSVASRPALKPTHPAVQCVDRVLSPGIKPLGLQADHLHAVLRSRMSGSVLPLPHIPSWFV